MNKFCVWVKRVCCWFVSDKDILAAIICFFVILDSLYLGFFVLADEYSIKIIGYFLQLVGMLATIQILLDIRCRVLKKAPLYQHLYQHFSNWFSSFPKWRNSVILDVDSSINACYSADIAWSIGWSKDNPESTIEERVDLIVKNLKWLKETNYKFHTELKSSLDNLKKIQEDGDAKIESKIKTTLDDIHINGLIEYLACLVWLLVGMTMATFAEEITLFIK